MNKNAIKKFATEARRELISRVSQRALKYGISDKEVGNPNDDSVGGHLLSSTEKKQRAALIAQIKEKGYEQVMEEVAYTWFNRFSALRFMEVNGYLPSHVRVFTDEENNFKPQIISEAIHLELDGLDMEKVYAYKEANDNDELYKYLLITQCNALNNVLPGMFQKIADYTELLFPDNLLREGSVIQQMIELIPEDDWKDAVQIIGWLYQYYNSEKKDDVFAALKKNVKITKENIPAATQLFTPDWIVRYMVENSLGRLWLEGHPDVKEQLLPTEEEQSAYAAGNRDPEDTKWHYYLEEAEQEPEDGIDYRQSQHLVHPSVQLRPKVISGNRLHSLIQPHHNHHYNENQTVHDAESPDSQVAAILLQPLIDNDNDEAGCQVHQERRHADSKRIEYNLTFQTEYPPVEMQQLVLIAEKLELPRQRDDLRHNGSDGSATYAPAETIDKHRVEYGIDNHRGYGGIHRLLRMPCGTKYRIQAQV